MSYMNRNPEFDTLERDYGIVMPEARILLPDNDRRMLSDWGLAMDSISQLGLDAQQTMVTVGSSGIPALFTSIVDPDVIRVILAPLEGADILGEAKKGSWIDDVMIFPMVEMTGVVSSYDDYSNDGVAGANQTWPQRQSYHFQVIIRYGEREVDRAGAAKLNWVSELQGAAANALNRYQDLTYHFGVAGLQNYGLLNDPQLPAALTPMTKAATGTRWITAGGVMNATANEVYADIQSLFYQLTNQSQGAINMKSPMTLVLPPAVGVALTITNIYNVNVTKLLNDNFPNLEIKTDIRYATTGGNVIQLFARQVEGKDTGYCAFTEKMRTHPLIKDVSSMKQKQSSGTWGAVIRYPVAFVQMLGV